MRSLFIAGAGAWAILGVALSLSAVACGSRPGETASENDPQRVGVEDASADAPVPDAADAASPRPPDGGFEVGAFSATFGDVTRSFDRAVYGFDVPDKGPRRLYVEIYAGGDPGCPVQRSATPRQTIIVSGVPLPEVSSDPSPVTVTLLDFRRELTDLPAVMSTAATWLSVRSSDVEETDGFVEFQLAATFGGSGTAQGSFQATYCPSLDAL